MKLTPSFHAFLVPSLLAVAAAGASATSTNAEAVARVQSYADIVQATNGAAEGTAAAAARTVPGGSTGSGEAFVSALGSAHVGTLGAGSQVRGLTAGDLQGIANTSWSDSFAIVAAGHGGSETGTFSGSVQVTGALTAEFLGRAYVGSSVGASIDLFPATGFNGGRTYVGGGGSISYGYDIPGGSSGSPGFTLNFVDVPFTFGRTITFTMALQLQAWTRLLYGMPGLIDDGWAQATSQASMSWRGISVTDGAGQSLADFSALGSGSAFNFAHAAPVPEPAPAALLIAGLLCVARRLRSRAEGSLQPA